MNNYKDIEKINKRAEMVKYICKKDNGKYDDFSIYKNYIIRLYAFGVRDKCNENFTVEEYNQIIAPRFMEYCLDYRKGNRWDKIHMAILDGFSVRENTKGGYYE